MHGPKTSVVGPLKLPTKIGDVTVEYSAWTKLYRFSYCGVCWEASPEFLATHKHLASWFASMKNTAYKKAQTIKAPSHVYGAEIDAKLKGIVGKFWTTQLVDDLVDAPSKALAKDDLSGIIKNFHTSYPEFVAWKKDKPIKTAQTKGNPVDAFTKLTTAVAGFLDTEAPKPQKPKAPPISDAQAQKLYEEAMQVASKPPIHVLVYGDAGAKKSTFAATFPKPMLVLFFDPFGKDMPYLRRGKPGQVAETDEGYRIRFVHKKDAELGDHPIIRLEYFHNLDPEQPIAYRQFLERIAHATDLDAYKTIVVDSVTFMNLAKFHEAKYKTNKHAKDPRQWYAAAKEGLEEMLMVRFAGLMQNVVVLAHVNEDKDEVHGNFVYNPAVPGKLSKGLPAGYAEFYRAFVKTEQGKNEYLLQTQKNAQFNAATQIPAPNPCAPSYKALWEEYEA